MTSFTEDMQRRGMVPSSKTLELKTVPPAPASAPVRVSPSERIVVVTRLRYADRETMAIETLHVAESLVPGLTAKDLERHRSTSCSRIVSASSSSAAARRSSRP